MTVPSWAVVRNLRSAAEAAAGASSYRKAITAAWSRLHAPRDAEVMGESFAAWCRAEGFGGHPSGLGEVLRRRYRTADEVVASLERAAELAERSP